MRVELPKRYWNPVTETMPRADLAELQLRKLQTQLHHLYDHSPFYRQRMDTAGRSPDQIGSLDDYFKRFPILFRDDLTKAELERPPYGTLAAVDPKYAVFHHQTSGSTGAPPIRSFDTARDWTWVSDMWATALTGMGVREGDRAVAAFGYALFIGFWGAHYGIQRMGCEMLSTGGLDTQKRIELIMDLGINVFLTTPTYALRVAQVATELGVDLANDSPISLVVTSGEPRPQSTRKIVEDVFDAYVADCAGMTEAGTVFMFECVEDPGGMHIIETDVIEEVLNPETRQPVDYGEQGVRVMTTLGREGIAVLRYWTNDLVVRKPYTECSCGRTWDLYEGGIRGRADHLRKVRGVWFTPIMVEDLVRSKFPDIDEFQIKLAKVQGIDALIIQLEPLASTPHERYEDLRARFGVEAKRALTLTPEVEVVIPGTLPRFEMKAKRFEDIRQQSER
ncbi:MAG: phenylacetate-CoA ligase [Actinomycetota bacterium]|nr:phenylacetate-CoA ligase [Actinomycetota bacterium]